MSKHQDPTLHGEENDQEDQEEEYIPTSAQPPSRHQEEPIIRPPSPSVVIYSPSLSPDDRHIRSSPIRSHRNNTSSGLRSALANPLQPRRSSTTPRKSVRFTGATSRKSCYADLVIGKNLPGIVLSLLRQCLLTICIQISSRRLRLHPSRSRDRQPERSLHCRSHPRPKRSSA